MPSSITTTEVFDLPEHRAAKLDPARIDADRAQFVAIAEAIARTTDDLGARLEAAFATHGTGGQGRVEREAEVRHLRGRLRVLRAFSLDTCLGRMTPADGSAPVYIGRIGLTDPHGTPLLIDWRSPAAEPFFAATRRRPMGLASRRRYRWGAGRVRDYWDETLQVGAGEQDDGGRNEPDPAGTALDDESAFLETLAESRSSTMRDVLTTLAADQDAIIRADARGPLVVDGGPGTGKTVAALHRAAYLLYAEPRLRRAQQSTRDGILFIGPHRPFLAYVAEVLPALGEEDVRTATLRDMLPEGAAAGAEPDPQVARLKADARMVEAVEPAIALYEEPPTTPLDVETDWGSVRITARDWAEAFADVDAAVPHNLAHEQIWDALAEIVTDELSEEYGVDEEGWTFEDAPDAPGRNQVRAALMRETELVSVLQKAWPILDPQNIIADLWEVPAYLRRSAGWLNDEQAGLLCREDPRAWTASDLPLLDAARARLGDPGAAGKQQRQDAARMEAEAELGGMVDDLIAADSSEIQEMSMLRGADMRAAFVQGSGMADEVADPIGAGVPGPETLAGPFAHVVVDEAQELDDAQWAMILRRCPSRSLTIVGDRAQAAGGFDGTWSQRLDRIGLDRVREASLSINYRTPVEIMGQAEPVIRAVLPDANVPRSIRESGLPVRHGQERDLEAVVAGWLAAHEEGTVCVIADVARLGGARELCGEDARLSVLTPELAKGLEFDLVVLLAPDAWAPVARYVAMTRATSELVLLDGAP